MDLLVKVAVLVIVLVVIAGAAFYIFVHQMQSGPLTQAQAENTVLTDIKASSPTATVTVVSVSPSTLENDSWNIVLSVAYNITRPCPTLSIESFDYPATGLAGSPSTDNLYSTSKLNNITGMRECVIIGLSYAPTYVISSPYIAISRAYITNATELTNYVQDYGYNNVNAYASFYSNLSASMTPLNLNYNNVWVVNFTAPRAPFNQYVILGQNGQILANYTK
jgi:hypothetical protein